jgi:hypothetical protein
MQFNIDSTSHFKPLFFKLRELLLSFETMHEVKNAKQTAYYDTYGAIAFLRPHHDGVHYTLALANGAKLQDNFPMLEGCGKIVRHLYFKEVEDVNEGFIREIIEESLVLNLEKHELKKLKKSFT